MHQSKIKNQTASTAAAAAKSKITSPAFTLIEILIVVAIMGIAGAIVVPHMLTAGTMGIQAAARMVIADLLYAQNEAIANQSVRKVIFEPAQDGAGNRYRITDAADQTIDVDWKGGDGGNYVVDFEQETSRFGRVRITSVQFSEDNPNQVAFDALGSPSSGGTIDLTFQDTVYRITVAAFTGRVTVQKL
ncbi:MAG: GspH/FimT family pseudopilin [Phycisphaeraceae bacterium]|nr:GspH/FimT family pseudopilin [Phycisphaeraceae bacterium]